MAISFEMIGKLTLPKETETFKNYEEKEYASGWVNKTLNMNLISGDNRFMLRARGGYFKNGEGQVYLFSKDTFDDKFDIPELMADPKNKLCRFLHLSMQMDGV